MGKLEQRFLTVYLAWVIIELFMQIWKDNFPVLHGFVKGGLMPILIALVVTTPRFPNYRIRLLLMASLVFAWAGDILLLFDDILLVPGEDDRVVYFKAGLASFLVAQFLYIVIFSKHQKKNNKRSLVARRPMILLIMLIVTGMVLNEVKDSAGDLIVPILVYTLALLGMVVSALNRRGRTNEISFWLVVLGAFSFLLSDSLIAIDHFHTPIDGMYIMATYMFAQGCIVTGLMAHSERRLEAEALL